MIDPEFQAYSDELDKHLQALDLQERMQNVANTPISVEQAVALMNHKAALGMAALVGAAVGQAIEDMVPRLPGCECHIEEGDSACPVHGSNDEEFPEETRIDLNDSDEFEVEP